MHETPVPYGEEYPPFKRVSIETATGCTRRCEFCPVSWHPPRGKHPMRDELFAKIVGELAGFRGVVQMYLLNEPLLDPKFLERASELRESCPRATIQVATNGDPLRNWRVAMADLEAAGVNAMHFSCYSDDDWASAGVLMSGYRVTEHPYRRHPVRRLHVARLDFRPGKRNKFLTRLHPRGREGAGKAPDAYCSRCQNHIVVTQGGDVPLCCAVDPLDLKLPRHGNVRDSTLKEIWNSRSMFEYRLHTQQRKRDLPGCERCSHRMAYPHVVRKVSMP